MAEDTIFLDEDSQEGMGLSIQDFFSDTVDYIADKASNLWIRLGHRSEYKACYRRLEKVRHDLSNEGLAIMAIYHVRNKTGFLDKALVSE